MIPGQASSRLLLAAIIALAVLAAVAAVLGSALGPAAGFLALVLLGELVMIAVRTPGESLVHRLLLALGLAGLALVLLTAALDAPLAVAGALLLLAGASGFTIAGLAPRVPWPNYGMAAGIAGLLAGAIVAAMTFRAPGPVLVAGILAAGVAGFLTVPMSVLGRTATMGALLLTVPPVVVALNPLMGGTARNLLTALGIACLLAGYLAVTLGVLTAVRPAVKEREEAPPLASIWDHLRAQA